MLDVREKGGFREPRIQANPDPKPYSEYLPGQVEHCLRLTMERLQLGLKKGGANLTNGEVADLAEAAHHIYQIYSAINK